MPTPLGPNPPRILLIRLRAIGDVVLITPLIRALKKNHPNAELHVLTDALPGTLLSGNPYVDRLWTAPARQAPFFEQIRFLRSLRSAHFGYTFDLFGNPRSAWMTLATGAPLRVGYAYRVRRFAYTHPVPMNHARKYQVEVNLDVLRHVGIPNDGTRTELFLRDEEKSWARSELDHIGWGPQKKHIALNPTGSWSAKRWPEDHWTGLTDSLAAKGLRPLVFWTPGDPEGVLPWAEKMGEKVLLAPLTDLRQMTAILSQLDLLVGNDGAPQHIAQALGTPTLTVFGPTWGKSWMPPDDSRHQFLQHFLDCGPCDKTLCPFPEPPEKGSHEQRECLKRITPEKVMAKVSEMLSGNAEGKSTKA